MTAIDRTGVVDVRAGAGDEGVSDDESAAKRDGRATEARLPPTGQ